MKDAEAHLKVKAVGLDAGDLELHFLSWTRRTRGTNHRYFHWDWDCQASGSGLTEISATASKISLASASTGSDTLMSGSAECPLQDHVATK